jgi:hypothetical protein
MVEGTEPTFTAADPDLLGSCTDVAVIVAIPVRDEVKTPDGLIDPILLLHVTAELYAPVPLTVAAHWEFCAVVIVDGAQLTVTEVIVGAGDVIVTEAFPLTDGSCTDVAKIVATPVVDGVKTPDGEMLPLVALHVTAWPGVPFVPYTEAEHCDVCVVVMVDGVHVTLTPVTLGPTSIVTGIA